MWCSTFQRGSNLMVSLCTDYTPHYQQDIDL
jgi:hypothetical protein